MTLYKSVLSVLSFVSFASVASAATVYSYDGPSYSRTSNNAGLLTYDTSLAVSGSFTVSDPLISIGNTDIDSGQFGLVDITAQVTSFSFTDGLQVVDQDSGWDDISFRLATDATGNIARAFVILQNNAHLEDGTGIARQIIARNSIDKSNTDVGIGTIGRCFRSTANFCAGGSRAFDFGVGIGAGEWSQAEAAIETAPSPVPLPASWSMLLVGLAGFGVVAHRRKRSSMA